MTNFIFTRIKLVFFFLLFSINFLFSQNAGDIDFSFNANDQDLEYGTGANHPVSVTVVQPDDKILISGEFWMYNGMESAHLARLNTDGNIDKSFHTGSGVSGDIRDICIQNDNKIIVAGVFNEYNETPCKNVVRLNSDGSIDNAFHLKCYGSNGSIFTIAINSAGKIFIAGSFTQFNNKNFNNVVLLNSDGTLEPSFKSGNGADLRILCSAIQNDGKIIIGGEFTKYNGKVVNRIARLNIDGTLDTTFNTGLGANISINDIAIQKDGKIILVGGFTFFNSRQAYSIVRLNIDGSIDTTFNSYGSGYAFNSLAIQPDNKILVVGLFDDYNGVKIDNVARLNIDGSIDSTFKPIANYWGPLLSLCIRNDRKIYVGGVIPFRSNLLYSGLLNNDGSIDSTFNKGTSADQAVYATLNLYDNQILVGGAFKYYDSRNTGPLVKLNSDGSADTTFVSGFQGQGNIYINTFLLQDDGKILVGGKFSTYDSISRNGIMRINQNGIIDTSFNPGQGIDGEVTSITLLKNGKIVISGNFSKYNNVIKNNIVCVNSDGSIDTTYFQKGTDWPIMTTQEMTDGSILIGGFFTTVEDLPYSNFAKYFFDGKVDTIFNNRVNVNSAIQSIVITPNDQILIGGDFSVINGVNQSCFSRLFQTGQLDTTFKYNNTIDGSVSEILIHDDGKIYIGGDFIINSTFNKKNIICFNADGSYAPIFNYGLGTDDFIGSICKFGHDKVIIGGGFNMYNGVVRKKIARLYSEYKLPDTLIAHTNNFCEDSLYFSIIDTCHFQYSIPIDTFFVSSHKYIDNVLYLDLKIYQGSKAFNLTVSAYQRDIKEGMSQLFLSFKCYQNNDTNETVLVMPYYIVLTKISDKTDNSFFTISPNPAYNYINFSLNEKAEVMIYNLLGEVVICQIYCPKEVVIDISNFASGTYILSLKLKNQTYMKQIVKY